eukprot:TRINITY_DN3744_c0_g2_i4.p1 TRINITY_DN3744_c0_g2~~TRINITY_DN3744_c0_g2_i4.p1  ORF type:complete len:1342 (-),score=216.12 TRINITY_DN3744_c0_g2_i4:987-5012(-)
MPYLNGQEWEPNNLPFVDNNGDKNRLGDDKDTSVFFVRATSEVFYDYEAYLERLKLLNSKSWSCVYSGKKNLTYMEAKQSEDNWDKVLSRFPEEVQEKAVRCIHHSRENLEDLINTILQDLKTQSSPKENEPENRSKPDIPKRAMRAFIHKVSRKVGPQKGVWIVNEDYCDKYGLQKELPVALGLELALWQKQRAKRSAAQSGHRDDEGKSSKKSKKSASVTASESGNVGSRQLQGNDANDEDMDMKDSGNTTQVNGIILDQTIVGGEDVKPVTGVDIPNGDTHDHMSDPKVAEIINEELSRLRPNTLKHATFRVLMDKGLAGIKVDEIISEIQEKGYMPEDYQWKEGTRSTLQQHLIKGDIFARVGKGLFALACLPGANAINYKLVGSLDDSNFQDSKDIPESNDNQEDQTDDKDKTQPNQRSIVEMILLEHERAAEKITEKIQEQAAVIDKLQVDIQQAKNKQQQESIGQQFEVMSVTDSQQNVTNQVQSQQVRQQLTQKDEKLRELEGQFKKAQKKMEALCKQLEHAQKSVKEAKELVEKEKICTENDIDSSVLTHVNAPKFPMEDTHLLQYLEMQAHQNKTALPPKDVFTPTNQLAQPYSTTLGDFLGASTLLCQLAKSLEMNFANPTSSGTYRALKQLQFAELFSNFLRASSDQQQMTEVFCQQFQILKEGSGSVQIKDKEEAWKNVGKIYSGLVGWLLRQLKDSKQSTRLDRRWRQVLKDVTWPEIVVRFVSQDLRHSDHAEHYSGLQDALQRLKSPLTASLSDHGLILRYLCDEVLDSDTLKEEMDDRLDTAENVVRETKELVLEDKKKLKQMIDEERELKRRKREEAQENATAVDQGGNNDNITDVDIKPQGKTISVTADIRTFFKKADNEGNQEESGNATLPSDLQYAGDPNDKKALIQFRQLAQAARKEQQAQQAKLEQQRWEQLRLQKQEEKEARERERQIENVKESITGHQESLESRLDKLAVRRVPLGYDRQRRQYWWGVGHLYSCLLVEDLEGHWGLFNTIEQIEELMQSLDDRGEREKELRTVLERRYDDIADQFKKSLSVQTQVVVKQTGEQPTLTIPERFQPSRRAKVISYQQPVTMGVDVRRAEKTFIDNFKLYFEEGFDKLCIVSVIEQLHELVCCAVDSNYPGPDKGWDFVLVQMTEQVNLVYNSSIENSEPENQSYLSGVLDALKKVLLDIEDHLFKSSGYQFPKGRRLNDGDDEDMADDMSHVGDDEQSEQVEDHEDGSSLTMSISDMNDSSTSAALRSEWADNEDERTASRHQKRPRKVPWYSQRERSSWIVDVNKANTASHLTYTCSVFYLYSKPIFKLYEPPAKTSSEKGGKFSRI